MPREQNDPRDALFERLYEALHEDGVEDLAEQVAALQRQDIDVETTIAEGLQLFAAFRGQQKLARARVRVERLQRAVQEFLHGTSDSMVAARQEIAQLLAGESRGRLYAAVHRKLEAVSAEDLQSLSDDAALAAFLERCADEV